MAKSGPYALAHARSLEDPDGFWGEAAKAIDWDVEPPRVLDGSDAPYYRWFTGGRLNTCWNALDRHVEAGHGDRTALIYDSPVTGTVETFTYSRLRDEVATFAGGLRSLGVAAGDRVVLYMPMVPQAVIAMLATARLGAVHSVVFGGFAPHELAIRIDDATPKVVLSASCGIEPGRVVEYKPMLDRALELGGAFERLARRRVQIHRKTELAEPRQALGKVIDGVVGNRPRAVTALVENLKGKIRVHLFGKADVVGEAFAVHQDSAAAQSQARFGA